MPRLLQPRPPPSYSAFTLLAFLLYFCGFSHTRLNIHCSTCGNGGRGSVEKFFSLVFPAHTQRKRYFIEFFVAQKRVCAENCCWHKVFHFIFHSCPFASYSCHAPRPLPCCSFTLLLASFFKNFASFCRFCVDFRQPDCAPFPLSSFPFPLFLYSPPLSPAFHLSFLFVALAFFNPIEA